MLAHVLAPGAGEILRSDRGTGIDAIGALDIRVREVAPLLRLLHQQTAQSLQAILTMVVVFAILWGLAPRNDEVGHAFLVVLFLTMAATVVGQAFDRVRFVVRQGFTVSDVHAAVDAITDETARAREQLQADPVEFRRIRRRRRISFYGGLLGLVSQPIAISLFVSAREDGLRQVQTTGVLIVLGGAVAIGTAIALWAMRPLRITVAQRIAGRFWRVAVGRWMFARAERRYARELSARKA